MTVLPARALRLLPLVGWVAATSAAAQDLEPRRWSHLPVGTDVLALGYVYTTGDVSLDPVLQIEGAEVELHTALVGYSRYFELLQRTARLDVKVPAQVGNWDGTLAGAPASTDREGLADPTVRLSVLLAGAPALSGPEYMEYVRRNPVRTTLGAALALEAPLGDYQSDKLINLGNNRFSFRPQLGVLHTRGEWSFELTGSAFLYTDNDDFFGGMRLEQDPLFATQAHVVKTFGRDFWFSFGAAYAWAGETTVDGAPKDDDRSLLLWGPSVGVRIGEAQSLKFGYVRTDTLTDTGPDSDSLAVGWSFRF